MLAKASQFLNIGDYFNHLFSGELRAENPLARTTQLAQSAQTRLVGKSDSPIQAAAAPEIVASGTPLGPLLPAFAEETGLRDVTVVAGCSHDTACAVAAVPAGGHNGWALLQLRHMVAARR